MEIPPWHVGHVVRKLMLASKPEMTRGQLAERAELSPMTVTHLLKFGRSNEATLEAAARVFDLTAFDLRAELDRSNVGRLGSTLPMVTVEMRRRLTDRNTDELEAEQYARRIVRLANSAQTAIYNTIRALEEAYGLLKRNPD